MFGQIKYTLMLIGFCTLFGAGVYLLYGAFDYENIYKNANIWYKVSSDPLNPGEIVALDMSKGYSVCEGPYIYMAVNAIEADEEIVLVFPSRGPWHAEPIDTVSVEIQKNFGKLEEDLRNK